MKKDIENSSKENLAFKNEQAEARKQAKIAQELENRPWYEKAWDTTKTFTSEVSAYYDCKRTTEGVVPVIFWNEEDLSSDEVVKIALAYKEEK
ncbi:hypothetical protein [Bacillus sp. UMB0893]|uniref:hypothetical protein n=1 Tax=Bacillus sp. UMB0893 TaxID=2066053 RepID=UPI000C756F10|nr:hypothetical protein [Bacillus sp. UMB0893]PLR66497.1 hypothetical protein CYJ36_17815 [Bacillus sp. UMB0893]